MFYSEAPVTPLLLPGSKETKVIFLHHLAFPHVIRLRRVNKARAINGIFPN